MWTPFQINLILHFHTRYDEHPQASAPIYDETVARLVSVGVIHTHDGRLTTTELGKALVKMWRKTPLPAHVWVDPRTDERLDNGEEH